MRATVGGSKGQKKTLDSFSFFSVRVSKPPPSLRRRLSLVPHAPISPEKTPARQLRRPGTCLRSGVCGETARVEAETCGDWKLLGRLRAAATCCY
ncbi:hypothetical protein V6Z12_D01G085800 [Gossypium hirsutum]